MLLLSLLETDGASAETRRAHTDVYAGTVFGDPGSRILLKVRFEGGRPTEVEFKVRKVTFDCEDGTSFEAPLPRLSGEFGRSRQFDADRWALSSLGTVTFYEAEGALLKRGRARGTLFGIQNPFDPIAGPTSRECEIAGGLPQWRAERRR